MNFIKKYWLVFFVLMFAISLRLINLDKPTGLWYDEMTLYSIASQKSILGMMNADMHRFLMFPVYFLVYKLWILAFGNTDFVIRLMSVFFDVLAVCVAYFVGKQVAVNIGKTEHRYSLGIANMLFYAINASFIYYAQEAKFYSLAFLLVNLLILFWLKILRTEKKTNSITFLIVNALLLYTYTSQAMLILVIMGVTCVYWLTKNRFLTNLKLLVSWIAIFIPLIILMTYYPNYYSGNFDAVVYDGTFVLLVIQNWFAPMLTALQNNILEYDKFIFKFILNPNLWMLFLLPTIIALSLIVKCAKRFNIGRYIVAVPIIFIGLHVILSEISSYNALVRYTLTALPFAILCLAIGFDNLKSKKTKVFLLCAILLFNITALFSKYGAVNIKRPDGYKVLAQKLVSENINPNENYVLPIRSEHLEKYFIVKGQKYNLYELNSTEAQKTYLNKKEIEEISKKNDLYKNYKRYLTTTQISKEFEQYVTKNYIENSDEGIVVVVDKSICSFDPFALNKILNSADYEKYPIQFLRLSKLNNDLLTVLNKKMKLTNYKSFGNWEIIEFHKH